MEKKSIVYVMSLIYYICNDCCLIVNFIVVFLRNVIRNIIMYFLIKIVSCWDIF